MKKYITISLLFLLFIPLSTYASLDTNLYYGLKQNNNVTQLQNFLINKGFLTVNATGNFFSLTLKAVKAYQASQNISQTGYVGILTRKAINSQLAINPSASTSQATDGTGATAQTPSQIAATNNVAVSSQPVTGGGGGASSTTESSGGINDIATALQTQIMALQDQLSLMQQQSNPQDAGKLITSFKLLGFNPEINGGIVYSNHAITVVVPDGTDVTTLIPTIQISANATVYPNSGVMKDFTYPITYTVTDTYGSTQNYTVTVVTESNSG